MLVVDTSAVLHALVASAPSPELLDLLGTDRDLQAPHLIDVELLHALRRLWLSGELSEERAEDLRTDYRDLALVRWPHDVLADRVWELRHNLTAYDATFVALAEALGAPLVTCDGRLSTAPGHGASVRLFGGPG